MKTARCESAEARKSARNGVAVCCILKIEEALSPAFLLDVSAEGGFIKCEKRIHPGSKGHAADGFARPGFRHLSSASRPKWFMPEDFSRNMHNFAGFGVRFESLAEDEKNKLQNRTARDPKPASKKIQPL